MYATSVRHALTRGLVTLIPVLALLGTAVGSARLSGVFDIPRQGQKVGKEIEAHGSLTPAAGYHFWLLARAHEYDPLWYPQREVQPDLTTGKWTGLVTFGVSSDVGKTFDVALIAVPPDGHELVRKRWLDAMKSGNWTPIELPANAEVLATLSVAKVP